MLPLPAHDAAVRAKDQAHPDDQTRPIGVARQAFQCQIAAMAPCAGAQRTQLGAVQIDRDLLGLRCSPRLQLPLWEGAKMHDVASPAWRLLDRIDAPQQCRQRHRPKPASIAEHGHLRLQQRYPDLVAT